MNNLPSIDLLSKCPLQLEWARLESQNPDWDLPGTAPATSQVCVSRSLPRKETKDSGSGTLACQVANEPLHPTPLPRQMMIISSVDVQVKRASLF